MSILSIDQSLSGTAIAHIDNDCNIIETIMVDTDSMRGTYRLNYIVKEIIKACDKVEDRFLIVREGYSFGSKGRATFSLGELGGCIDLSLYNYKNDKFKAYYVLSPGVWKKYCLQSGSVKKDSSYLLKVYNRFKIQFENDNIADAYMLGYSLVGLLKASKNVDGFIDNLTLPSKEALLSGMIGKKGTGITKATLKKMDNEEFSRNVFTCLNKCLSFVKE